MVWNGSIKIIIIVIAMHLVVRDNYQALNDPINYDIIVIVLHLLSTEHCQLQNNSIERNCILILPSLQRSEVNTLPYDRMWMVQSNCKRKTISKSLHGDRLSRGSNPYPRGHRPSALPIGYYAQQWPIIHHVMMLSKCDSFIHSRYSCSATSSPLLLRGASDYRIDTVSKLTRSRSATGNCEWRTCPRSLRGGWSGIRTCNPADARHRTLLLYRPPRPSRPTGHAQWLDTVTVSRESWKLHSAKLSLCNVLAV